MLHFIETDGGYIVKEKNLKVSPCFKEVYECLMHLKPHERYKEYVRLYKEDQIPCKGVQFTLDEIALLYGISKERVRQIEEMGKRKLKHPKVAKKLKDYLYS